MGAYGKLFTGLRPYEDGKGTYRTKKARQQSNRFSTEKEKGVCLCVDVEGHKLTQIQFLGIDIIINHKGN